MDLYLTLACPIEAAFGYLADPSHLGDWLPPVAAAGPASPGGDGAEFPLTARVGGIRVAATGEMTAFEPPWLIGYRLFIGSRAHGLRVTCTAQPGGTRIHVHQPDETAPLTIDLPRLARGIQQAHRRKGQPC
jgi:hypothetical protein